MRFCLKCGEEIPAGRLKAIPNATTCVEHSEAEQVAGYMSWDGKTAPQLNVVSQSEANRIKDLQSKRVPK
jgi:hypothetical protein